MDGLAWKLLAFDLLFWAGADSEIVIGRSRLELRIRMKQLARLLHSDRPFCIRSLYRRNIVYMFAIVAPIRCVRVFGLASHVSETACGSQP